MEEHENKTNHTWTFPFQTFTVIYMEVKGFYGAKMKKKREGVFFLLEVLWQKYSTFDFSDNPTLFDMVIVD